MTTPDQTHAPLRAYHGDPALRARTLAQMQAHHDADEIVQGTYWGRGRGCAVGCLTHDPHGGHALYPVRWGIPELLARLEDRIFEGLSAEEARAWPIAFLGAIPLGADLSLVWPRFALAILTDEARGVRRLTAEGSDQRAAVDRVGALFRRVVGGEGEVVSREEWGTAYAAAHAAAAHAAADAAAAACAYAAADACAYAAADAAGRTHYRWMADLLLALLAAAPVPV